MRQSPVANAVVFRAMGPLPDSGREKTPDVLENRAFDDRVQHLVQQHGQHAERLQSNEGGGGNADVRTGSAIEYPHGNLEPPLNARAVD
jgi:hypothetical protein